MDRVEIPQSHCRVGIATTDVTPPVGIYHRMWGAATHDRSTGVHRPLTATALWLADLNDRQASRVMVGLDHCLLWTSEMRDFLDRVSELAEVERDAIFVFFSHTHAAGLMGYERESLPGGELIRDYLDRTSAATAKIVREARDGQQAATICYASGKCNLAANRDYYDQQRGTYVCGHNPDGVADDTVLVGRVSSVDGKTLATLVNYACHPTTLAWDNTLISPDYVGAMREVITEATHAPCLFIQGASGDIGPRDGYVGDVTVADRNGRQLGYAVLSALESLPKAMTTHRYVGPVVSGATIGTWEYLPVSDERRMQLATWQTRTDIASLNYRSDLLDFDALQRERARWSAEEQAARAAGNDARQREARAMVERTTRRLVGVSNLPDGDRYPFPIHVTRIGDAVWLALNGEHYNLLQRKLRDQFPGVPIVVGTLANGSDVWYVLEAAAYGKGLYQEDASVLEKGCLEDLLTALSKHVSEVLAD